MTPMNSAKSYHEGALKLYIVIVQLLLILYVKEDSIVKLNANMSKLGQESMTQSEFAQ